MKSLWKTILNGLTYTDLAGHRQPRVYTVITGILILLIMSVVGMASINRFVLMSKVQATPLPVTVPAETSQATPTRIKDATPIGCPTHPEEWSLSPVYYSKNYAVIQPACVYQGLEKTIAWALAVREGYSRAQATQLLGFTEMPMRRLDQVTIPVNAKGLGAVPVSFIPPNPDFTEWRLTPDGKPAVTYALRGCFRTSTVTGNRIEGWGGDYSVICLVAEDAENTHIVYSFEGHTYTSSATPMRSFLLFGYVSDGLWVWLGTQDDPKQEITDPQVNAHERLTIATLYDSQPWDAKWLTDNYHIMLQSPPENWRTLTDENEKQAILMGLSGDQNGGKP